MIVKIGKSVSKYGDILAFFLFAMALALYLYNLDGWRMDEEEGACLYQAWRICEGEFPYRDFLSPHSPLFLLTGASMMRVFGPSETAARAPSPLLATFASLPLYAMGKALFGPKVGLLSSLVFLLNPDVYWQGRLLKPQAYMAFFSTWGLYFFVKGSLRKRRWALLASGFVFALGTLSEFLGFLPLIGCLLALAWRTIRGERGLGDALALMVPYLVSVGIAFGLIHLWAPPFPKVMWEYYLAWDLRNGLRLYWSYFIGYIPFVFFALTPAIGGMMSEKHSLLAWQIPTALAFLLFRGSRPDLVYLLPTLAIFFSSFAIRISQFTPPPPSLVIGHWSLIIIIVLIPWGLVDKAAAKFPPTVIGPVVDYTTEIVDYIKANTEEEECILMDYPGLNFFSRRRTTYSGAALSSEATSSGYVMGRRLVEEIGAEEVKTILIDISYRKPHPIKWMKWMSLDVKAISIEASYLAFRQLEKLRDGICFRGYVGANFRYERKFESFGQKMEVLHLKDFPLIRRRVEGIEIEHPIRVDLGGIISLIGYDVMPEEVEPGGKVHLILFWQAKGGIEKDFTVFTHLIDGEDKIWGQKDSQPLGGTFPTSCWGEVVVVDTYEMPVREDAPPGEYRIEVGMYLLETMERLPAYDESGIRLRDDRILLEPVIIVKGL
jgi:hypothetical protein